MIQFDEHIFQMGWFNHQLEIESAIPHGSKKSRTNGPELEETPTKTSVNSSNSQLTLLRGPLVREGLSSFRKVNSSSFIMDTNQKQQ